MLYELPLNPEDVALILLIAFGVGMVETVAGFGGGLLLIATLLIWLQPGVVIPVISSSMILQNGYRLWLFRKDVVWPVVKRFWAGALPAVLVGLVVFDQLAHTAQGVLSVAVAVFIAYFLFTLIVSELWDWRESLRLMRAAAELSATAELLALGDDVEARDELASEKMPARRRSPLRFRTRLWWFVPAGVATGFLSTVVGGAGPVIAPFQLNYGLTRERFVGTMVAGAFLVNIVKGVGYFSTGWLQPGALALAGLIGVAMGPGAWIGKRVLRRTPRRAFVVLMTCILLLAGTKALLSGIESLTGTPEPAEPAAPSPEASDDDDRTDADTPG